MNRSKTCPPFLLPEFLDAAQFLAQASLELRVETKQETESSQPVTTEMTFKSSSGKVFSISLRAVFKEPNT